MKILFFGTKSYDKKFFDETLNDSKYEKILLEYTEAPLEQDTAILAKGYDAVCAFVNMELDAKTITSLDECRVKLILMRCAGFNNVDIKEAAKRGITVMRVPGYSPEAVAEHAMALALTANRHTHKAYVRVRENDFSLNGLMGTTLYGKTAGIIGTGKIGSAMAKICRGFGMEVIAYDTYENPGLDFVRYVSFDELLGKSDLISLHCPLTEETYHLINKDTISKMKQGVILINTSRGSLIKTEDLISGIRDNKFFAVGLDVYEEEDENVYENLSDSILQHSTTARLLNFPNVCVTSHQGFFAKEALEAISRTTLDNALCFINGTKNGNEVSLNS
jgi:D-lactate dehydrogenase